MKKIAHYIKDYLKTEFHLGLFLVTVLFVGASIWLNYTVGGKANYIDPFAGSLEKIGVNFLFIGVPWFFVLFFTIVFKGKQDYLKEPGFWTFIIIGILIFCVNDWFNFHKGWAKMIYPNAAYPFARSSLWNLKGLLLFLIPLWLFKLWQDRDMQGLYGLTAKNVDLRPYFILLAILLPFIIGASYTEGFKSFYPTLKPHDRMVEKAGMPRPLIFGIYEIFYLSNFLAVELYYRGFLVIGMMKWMGKQAILPMAALYCFIHFGKPMGEAISSFFGGATLGIIAYYTRNIWGGVIIHMGIAGAMDFMAYLHHYVFKH